MNELRKIDRYIDRNRLKYNEQTYVNKMKLRDGYKLT